MKKLFLLLVLSFLIFSSCTNEKPQRLSLNDNGYYFTVNIDGVPHSFNDKMSIKSTVSVSNILNGYNKNDKSRITLGLNLKNNETGTFNLENDITLAYRDKIDFKGKTISYIWHAKKKVLTSSAIITISKNTTTYLEGTFSFTGVGSTKIDTSIKKFTQGKFKIKK